MAMAIVLLQSAIAGLNIPSDGSDGALVITTDTVIDLSQASTNRWDADNTARKGTGVYDADKWAVVFKYASITVNAGATVTFKNHPSRAPVVWLVQGDVTINGTVSLDGKDPVASPGLAEPGPGGFRGGAMWYASGVAAGSGFGVGGGSALPDRSFGGAYLTALNTGSAQNPSKPYGNPSLIPLVGGSGGGGSTWYGQPNAGGGAGGGGLLVACGERFEMGGWLRAKGGRGNEYGGGGSGGGIRVVTHTLAGGGSIEATGGPSNGSGGLGRIRIERVTNSGNLQVTPDPDVVILTDGATPQIWLPDNGPTVKIVSIGGQAAPVDPRAAFGAVGADVTLPQVATTAVVVETTNVEQASVVKIRTTPRANGNYTETAAAVDQVVSSDPLVIRWIANVSVTNGYSAIQVKVVRP